MLYKVNIVPRNPESNLGRLKKTEFCVCPRAF